MDEAANDNEGPFDGLEPVAVGVYREEAEDHDLNPDAVIAYLARPITEMNDAEIATRDAYIREYDRLATDEATLTAAKRRLKAIAAVTPFFPRSKRR
jgi:hypothetical protein